MQKKETEKPKHEWTEVISSKHSLFYLNLREVWHYRDLLLMFIVRDYITSFKQTILGPLWFFINPILTTIVFTLIFGGVANLPTEGAPHLVFYLAGVTMWNYFSTALTATSTVFTGNAGIFGKVYFPRLIMPLTIVISNLMKFGIQLLLFIAVVIYYWIEGRVQPNLWAFFTPILIILMAAFALGMGMIFSSLTTKYRDMTFLLTFGVSLFMWITPVVLPLSYLQEKLGKYAFIVDYNPLSPIFEFFRYGWLGIGELSFGLMAYSIIAIFVILLLGTIIFNKVEKGFMDTV